MKQTYPYYTVCKVDAGQLVRLAHGKKFKEVEDCVVYINILKNKKIGSYVVEDYQIAIVKYTEAYACKIIYLYTNGNLLKICD